MKRILLFLLALGTAMTAAAETKVTLNIVEWPGYLSMHNEGFVAFAKSRGYDVTIRVVKPDISDEDNLFNTLRSNPTVDIVTPTESFLHSRGQKLLKLLNPVDPKKVENYARVPKMLRTSVFHRDRNGTDYGIVFMAGYYGLYYNTKFVSRAPDSWAVLWAPENRGKYSLSRDTYFVNAHIAQWTLDPAKPERAYDANLIDEQALGQKLTQLAKGASHLWEGEGNTPEQLKNLHYTASWGFELGPEWQLARPRPGSPMWIDVLSITEQAAHNPAKLAVFYLLATYVLQPEIQARFAQTLRSQPLTVAAGQVDPGLFNSRFYWHPLTERTANLLKNLWKTAQK